MNAPNQRRIGLWRNRFASLLLLLVAFAWHIAAGETTIRFLALKGDGSATVTIDGPVAYIADGGRKGERGIGGASVDGTSIPNYLRSNKIETVVISCSHPHDDHMAGLSELIQQRQLSDFSLHVVDALPRDKDGKYDPRSLAAIAEQTGVPFEYHSALNGNAFISVPRPSGSRLTVRNFTYDPQEIGKSEHDAATIVEYDFQRDERIRRIVDFDDASQALLAKWKQARRDPAGSVEYILLAPHHGSKHNSLADVLKDVSGFRVRDVIISANINNQYGHPSPSELLMLVQRLGADHVFITQSDTGTNVEIDATGDIARHVRAQAKERLNTYLANRRRYMEGKLSSLLEQAQRDNDIASIANLDRTNLTQREILIRYVRQSASLSDYYKNLFARLVADIDLIAQTQAEVRGAQVLADAFFASQVTSVLARAEGPKRERKAVLPSLQANADGNGTPGQLEPRPRIDPGSPGLSATPTPDQPSPAPSGEVFNNAATKSFAELRAQTQQDVARRYPGMSGSAGFASARAATFTASVRTTSVRFGGVVIGNRVSGPEAATRLEFVPLPDETGQPASHLNPLGYIVRVHFRDHTTADYSGFSAQDLWAAVNFVQPTQWLIDSLAEAGHPEPTGTDVGLVGIAGKRWFSTYFPRWGGWYFAVNPAVARTHLAFDAMRLDMLLSTAKALPRTDTSRPPALDALEFETTGFSTYQWHDVPSRVAVSNGVITVRPESQDASSCLMRVRLIDYDREPAYPSWYQPWTEGTAESSVKAEAQRRIDAYGMTDSLDEVTAAVWTEIDQIHLQAQELSTLDRITPALCDQVDSLQHVNRFAALVAVLTWFKQSSGAALPDLAFSAMMIDHELEDGFVSNNEVMPARVPLIRVEALGVALWHGLGLWAALLRVAGVLFLIGLLFRAIWRGARRRFAGPPG